MFNPIVQGWINYYGRFYKSMLYLVCIMYQRISCSLGHEEVQAVAPSLHQGRGVVGKRCLT